MDISFIIWFDVIYRNVYFELIFMLKKKMYILNFEGLNFFGFGKKLEE